MPTTEVRLFRDDDGSCPFVVWFNNLEKSEPQAWRKCRYLLLALSQLGNDLRRPLKAPLRDGVLELRGKVGRVNYRILYGFVGSNVAGVSHGVTKEAEIDPLEIDLAAKRLRLMIANPKKHTAKFKG